MILYVNDIFDVYNIEKTQLNINAVKGLVAALKSKDLCSYEKQKLNFNGEVFIYCWKIYLRFLDFFDPNYNRITDFSSFFKYIIDSLLYGNKMNFFALFCPGYTKYGYKEYLGDTTKCKLERLNNLKGLLSQLEIPSSITCCYSEVFLENTNYDLEPNWEKQLEFNKSLFHEEGEKYFDSQYVKNLSEVSVFSSSGDLEGYVSNEIIDSLPPRTYAAFKKSNEKFYKSLNFTEEQIQFRNDRLITMYRILSDYLNSLDNTVFLPMENMYERENIFSENNTCTMYLNLKK